MTKTTLVIRIYLLALFGQVSVFGPGNLAADSQQARQILSAAGVRGGLVVHLGCGDGSLTAALHADDGYLVHGLDADPANVDRARASIEALGVYGPVSVEHHDGPRLPYIDNLVNLVVAEDLAAVPMEEVLRVLVPKGVAYVKRDGEWSKTVKPRPAEIDDWTHYLHDASNNAVAHDERIGPPKHLQWQCGPRWSRHHDHLASVSAMVSSGGRVFCFLDEGSRISPQLPSDWKLVARDAFNGVLLWKRPMERWHTGLWPLKSGPASLPRRLVAVDEVVYATLGIEAPVSALDAATGNTIREYENTDGAEELLYAGGILLALVNRTPVDLDADLAADVEKGQSRDSRTTFSRQMARIWAGIRSRRWSNGDRVIRAFDARTGRPLWEKAGCVIPLTLAADDNIACYHDGEKIIALDLSTGREQWTSPPVPVWKGLEGQGLQSWFAPTLVVSDGKVLFAGGEKINMSYMGWATKDIGQDTMTALDAETGKKLWTAPHPFSGYNSPEDLFIIAGNVWTGVTAQGGPGGRYTARSLANGEITKDFPPTVDTYWFHHRCHRAKATDKYVLSSRAGIEFVDVVTGEWTINHWVRGGCLYGIMPCNGLVYSPPHPCACYPEAKLYGFTALAAARATTEGQSQSREASPRLGKGPAYTTGLSASSSPLSPDWPTYRGDAARSGATTSEVPTDLRPVWNIRLGGKLTPPIAAGNHIFLADVDRHTVHAIDAKSGDRLWSFTAGGPVDTPPTFDRGRVVFGSADGHVYCLRASDGALAWRFRAAPVDRRMVAFERLESVWPVHGSVLVQEGVATFVAGRSMYLDGGLRLCRLDVETGRLLSEKILDDRDPETKENLQVRVKGLNMPVALPDILTSDGEHLFMRSQVMDMKGNRLSLGPGRSGRDHLFAAYGFTDDSWFHRTYWLFGDGYSGGVGGFGNAKSKPAGLILTNNDETVFGYGRKPEYYRWSSVADYHLFAAARPGGESGAARAVYFDNTPSLDPTGKPITISAWVKTESANGTILVRGAQQNGFALILTDGKPRMLVRTKGTTHEALGGEPIGDEWTHLAGVLHDDGRMLVYVNGHQSGATEDVPLLTGQPSIPMKVGYDDTNQLLPEPLTPFDGALDEVMLFHRRLAPDEIQHLAKTQARLAEETLTDRVLHLDFTGRRTRDRSSFGNHGTMEGPKPETVEGPFGEALVLKQPKNVVPRRQGRGKSTVAYLWTQDVPLAVRAMALAGNRLLIAGPPNLLDEEAAFQNFANKSTQRQLAAHDEALKGQSGAIFHTVDALTGETLAEHRLDSPPVFDGLIASGGRVFIATVDGRLVAYGP